MTNYPQASGGKNIEKEKEAVMEPAKKVVDMPVDKPVDMPVDKPVDKPADKPVDIIPPMTRSQLAQLPGPLKIVPDATPAMDAAAAGNRMPKAEDAKPGKAIGNIFVYGTAPESEYAMRMSEPQCETPVMASVPGQQWGYPYEPDVGFTRGTIFPQLDLPFIGKGACKNGK